MADCYCWCTVCGVRLAAEEAQSWGCPKCGNQGTPCDPAEDVFVQVSWHELRILACFAERWAEQCHTASPEDLDCRPAVYAIAARLERQWPDLTPLALGREVQALAETHSVESNVPAPPPTPELGPGAVGHSRAAVGYCMSGPADGSLSCGQTPVR